MVESVTPLYGILTLNTKLFHNCLDGLQDRDARQRPDPRVNNVVFIGLHMCDARYHLANWLKLTLDNPFTRFAEVAHIDAMEEFPSLAEVVTAWDEVSVALEEHLQSLPAEVLEAPAPLDLPTSEDHLLACLAFMLQHEAYHIGQLSLLRKQLGFDAMKWT